MQYPHHDGYESPPPTSYFRRQGRPWSPDPEDPPSPAHWQADRLQQHYSGLYTGEGLSGGHSRRREPPEQSMEALDLADYGAFAQVRSTNDAPSRYEYLEYPPSPPPMRPFSVASRGTPSLASSPDTLSSQSYHTTTRTHPSHRPFSLPPSSSPNTLRTPPGSATHYEPHVRRSLDSVQELPLGGSDAEIDIAHFPAWSRHWYATPIDKEKGSRPANAFPLQSPDHAAFFNPGYTSEPHNDVYDPYIDSVSGEASSRDRNFLPWSRRDLTYGAPADESTKEERLRMLEQEFGPNAPASVSAAPERIVGSVDKKGNLTTEGPRKRLLVRVLEILLALIAAGSSIYAALAIKPPSSPPPQGRPSTYALYALSIISSLAFLWLFALRPCCCGRRKASSGLSGDSPAGLAVLPIQGLPGSKLPKKSERKQKGQNQSAVQVNLIVDPTIFMPGGLRDDREEDTESGIESNSALVSGSSGGPRAQPKRRGVFEGLAMERAWRVARKELKWMLILDIICLVLWAVEFVWVVTSGKCPPGGFDGWCNAFNVATASACILALAFGLSIFFDIKDLHQSSVSPRTRP